MLALCLIIAVGSISPAFALAYRETLAPTDVGYRCYWPIGDVMREIQSELTRLKHYSGPIDGVGGNNTARGIQTVARAGGYNGPIDGFFGINTCKGVQTYARNGGYTGPIDGDPRENSWRGFLKAMQLTYNNKGGESQIDKIIRIAKGEVGLSNGKKYANGTNQAWCAYFIIWCAQQAGIDRSIIYDRVPCASADDLVGNGTRYSAGSKWYPTAAVARRCNEAYRAYNPKRGDLIIFNWSGADTRSPSSFHGDHVGLVVSYNGSTVTVIEGNSGIPGYVRELTYYTNDYRIKGYAAPAYKS